MRGRRFYKMSGSGNDFIVFDSRDGDTQLLESAAVIRRLCDRRQGIGADGVVIIEPTQQRSAVLMKYFNSDGSRGTMCGNAALCVTRLAARLGLGREEAMTIDSDDGELASRLVGDRPEIDLQPLRQIRADAPAGLEAGEERIGYAVVGVPHVVVLCADVEDVDLAARGPGLRWAEWAGPDGANVNFVSRAGGAWSMRTFERGVEGETLACGTGAVASSAVLRAWGLTGAETALRTRSGCVLEVGLSEDSGRILARLRGEGRLVYEGVIGEV
jgi:diaminopimelate epimerase